MLNKEKLRSNAPYIVNLSLFIIYFLAYTFWDLLFMRTVFLSGRWYRGSFLALTAVLIIRIVSVFLLAFKKILFEIFFGAAFLIYIIYLKSLPSSASFMYLVVGDTKVSMGSITFLFLIAGILLCFYVAYAQFFRTAFGFPIRKRLKNCTGGAEIFRASRTEMLDGSVSPEPPSDSDDPTH